VSRFALAVFATGMRSVRDLELEAQKAVVAASAAESSAAHAREQLLSAPAAAASASCRGRVQCLASSRVVGIGIGFICVQAANRRCGAKL
jgi:hypothetical protein